MTFVSEERLVAMALDALEQIAKLNHPLIVATYQFGVLADYPYAVMELVEGSSAKEWLNSEPSLDARISVWQMYSRAMRFVHSRGELHGDPHLGNLLVFEDPAEAYSKPNWRGGPAIAAKLADTGTSQFWEKHIKFEKREGTLILETAQRLFNMEGFKKIYAGPAQLNYLHILTVSDAIVEYFELMNGISDHQGKSIRAGQIVKILIETPFFDLDEVIYQIRKSYMTDTGRVARRLNQNLFGFRDMFDASDEIDVKTLSAYQVLKDRYLTTQPK